MPLWRQRLPYKILKCMVTIQGIQILDLTKIVKYYKNLIFLLLIYFL